MILNLENFALLCMKFTKKLLFLCVGTCDGLDVDIWQGTARSQAGELNGKGLSKVWDLSLAGKVGAAAGESSVAILEVLHWECFGGYLCACYLSLV